MIDMLTHIGLILLLCIGVTTALIIFTVLIIFLIAGVRTYRNADALAKKVNKIEVEQAADVAKAISSVVPIRQRKNNNKDLN